jgi:hypothetical protein
MKKKEQVKQNTADYMSGPRHYKNIIITLFRHKYSILYLANKAVDLSYVRNGLSVDIIYMITHAGYFEVDGDHQEDTMVSGFMGWS